MALETVEKTEQSLTKQSLLVIPYSQKQSPGVSVQAQISAYQNTVDSLQNKRRELQEAREKIEQEIEDSLESKGLDSTSLKIAVEVVPISE